MRLSATALIGIALLLDASPSNAQDLAWARQLGGPDYQGAYAIAVDRWGNAHTTGPFYDTVDFDPGPGTYSLTSFYGVDDFVSKLDSSGDFVWARQFGGRTSGWGYDVAVDDAGNVYTTGFFRGTTDFDPGSGVYNLTALGAWDAFVSKLDSAGNFVWAKQFGGGDLTWGAALAVDSAGNVYTTGEFEGTADFDPGPGTFFLTAGGVDGAFVSKLDSAGGFVWAKAMGGPGDACGGGVAVDSEGNVYVNGIFSGNADLDPGPGTYPFAAAGGWDVFVSKLDASGDLVWTKAMGGLGDDTPYGIKLDGENNVYSIGYFSDTADFDPGPGVYHLTSAGGRDVFVGKLDPCGAFVWARSMGGSGDDAAYDIALDAAGSVYTTGYFQGIADFNPGPGAYELTSSGGIDGFVSKLDAAGNFVWVGKLGGTGDELGMGIAVDVVGTVYLAGEFAGTTDFDPGPGTYNLSSIAGDYDAFVWKGSDPCVRSIGEGQYGVLLFAPLCTRDADAELPGVPGEPYVFDRRDLALRRGAGDRLYLSGSGTTFTSFVVADAVRVNGQDLGIGPYGSQRGVPPFRLEAPLEFNLIPVPSAEITASVPEGPGVVSFEALDVDRGIFGNTAVYLLRDCGLWLEGITGGVTSLHFVSHDVDVGGLTTDLRVVTGLLSELRADRGYARAGCLGALSGTTQAADSRPDPATGDGWYYLARGTCSDPTYGRGSGATPDPRELLTASEPCP